MMHQLVSWVGYLSEALRVGHLSKVLRWGAVGGLLAGFLAVPAGGLAQTTELEFTNANFLYAPPEGIGGPYLWEDVVTSASPSVVTVRDVPGTITGLRIGLFGITADRVSDLNLLLVGPDGQEVMLLAGAGPDSAREAGMLFVSQVGNGQLTTTGWNNGATFQPTNNRGQYSLPSPAPAGPYGSDLNVFLGTNPNGEWKLYISDFAARQGETAADLNGLLKGWTVNVVTGLSDTIIAPPYDNSNDPACEITGTFGTRFMPTNGRWPSTDASLQETFYRLATAPNVPTAEEVPFVESGAHRMQWAWWTAPASGLLHVSTAGSSFDCYWNVATAASVVVHPIVEANRYLFPVQQGTTYFIRLIGKRDLQDDGTGVLYTTQPWVGDIRLQWELLGSGIERGPVAVDVTGLTQGFHVLDYDFWAQATTVSAYLIDSSTDLSNYEHSLGWRGAFLYDYSLGRFSQAMYLRRFDQATESTAPGGGSDPAVTDPAAGTGVHFSPTQYVQAYSYNGASWQELFYNFTTDQAEVSAVSASTGTAAFQLPIGNWVAAYHYDFTSGRYREFELRLKLVP